MPGRFHLDIAARGHRPMCRRWGLLAVLVAEGVLFLRFWTPFPDTWDAAEYSWCLRQDKLPHSPYLVFFLLGRLLHGLFPAPAALSLLSILSGIALLAVFHEFQRRWVWRELDDPRWREGLAAFATLLLGLSAVFVRETTHPEVYALQTAWLLLAMFLSAAGRRPALAGTVFALALATHGSSIFAAPAVAWPWIARRRWRSLAAWMAAAVAVATAAAAVIVLMLPPDPPQSRLAAGLEYLGGIAPGLDPGRWDGAFLAGSLAGQLERLFQIGSAPEWVPPARYPAGFTPVYLVVALAGAAVALRRRAGAAVWCLWPLPYLVYELLLGASPDIGSSLPLIAPAVCALAALAVGQLAVGQRRRRAGAWLAAGLAVALVAPGLVRIQGEWHRTRDAAAEHFTPQVLAAAWLDAHLPDDAVVVHTIEPSLNLLTYSSGRRPIWVRRGSATIFRDRGRFTPLNARSFEPLTHKHLVDLVRRGRRIVALEPDPFRDARGLRLDSLVWKKVAVIPPDAGGSKVSSPAVELYELVAAP